MWLGPSKREFQNLQEQLGRYQQAEEQKRQSDLVSQFHQDMAAIQEVVAPLTSIMQSLKNLDGMIQGLVQMTRVAADQLDEFKKVVEILERSMSSSERTYEEYADDTAEGQDRHRQTEVREMMRQGITEKEARARVRERNIYEEMARARRS